MEKGYNSKEIHQHSQPDFKRIRQMADRPASSAKSSEAELSNLTLKKAYSALSKKMLLLLEKRKRLVKTINQALKLDFYYLNERIMYI
ncbi:hypothetical protein LIT38_09140 [Bacillus sp. CMF12]|nr:hypothetical protein [Bacillus sp. CMF12]USK51585.1 hypothetical protein LIT38_09140 [Bacillus sp. CMF12]